jgi:hypothetical protein
MKITILPILILVGLITTIAGCTNRPPDCNSDASKKLVIQIAMKHEPRIDAPGMFRSQQHFEFFSSLAGMPTKYKVKSAEVVNVRTTAYDKESNSYSCEADLTYHLDEKEPLTKEYPITYRSEFADGGKKHFVTAWGLPK